MRSFRATERIFHYNQDGAQDGRIILVRANTYEVAAQHAINRLVSRRAIAHRTTGDIGMPGIFQGYRHYRGGGVTSTGNNILMVEV